LENSARNKAGFPLLYTIGVLIVIVVATSFGVFVYVAFGSSIRSVSLLNLPRGSVPAVFAQIGVVIATVLTYPLVYVVEHIVTKGQLLNSR
jgi:hypothetical protein